MEEIECSSTIGMALKLSIRHVVKQVVDKHGVDDTDVIRDNVLIELRREYLNTAHWDCKVMDDDEFDYYPRAYSKALYIA